MHFSVNNSADFFIVCLFVYCRLFWFQPCQDVCVTNKDQDLQQPSHSDSVHRLHHQLADDLLLQSHCWHEALCPLHCSSWSPPSLQFHLIIKTWLCLRLSHHLHFTVIPSDFKTLPKSHWFNWPQDVTHRFHHQLVCVDQQLCSVCGLQLHWRGISGGGWALTEDQLSGLVVEWPPWDW